MKYTSAALLALFAFTPSGFSQALSQPVLNGGTAWASDFRALTQASDTFSFASTTNIQGIRVWGVYTGSPDPLPQDEFTIRFFNVTAGVPDATAFQEFTNATVITRNLTALMAGSGESVYDITFDLGFQLQFAEGQTYALSIVNDTPDDLNPWRWMSSSDPDTNRFDRAGGASVNDVWSAQTSGSLAFELHATPVPEPGLMVAALVLTGLTVARVRGRKPSLKH